MALRIAYAVLAAVIILGLIANLFVRSLDRPSAPPAARTERFGGSDRPTYRTRAARGPVAPPDGPAP